MKWNGLCVLSQNTNFLYWYTLSSMKKLDDDPCKIVFFLSRKEGGFNCRWGLREEGVAGEAGQALIKTYQTQQGLGIINVELDPPREKVQAKEENGDKHVLQRTREASHPPDVRNL